MSINKKKAIKRTYFGFSSLVASILSAICLAAYFAVSQLRISPDEFYFWNIVTLLVSCLAAPLAVILGIIGYRKANDSKQLSTIAIVLISLPFMILFIQMALSFIP